ncbi:MAG: Uncharacterized protein G01um101448_812 [Parcubacteria group bacterium Gr01-1014_48]|nr:MAG: Uncharacterized protein Greene041614_1218 [Parcubacteria group bacterium Greene0416_14]TSC73319.1 MAG: Uncharacterized protein G01um101448_812 [Parcubacteria group bacterium Gr01-1014_48]TSC99946.1 MAG: Uncharacterized protein Greene101415_1016 [Parcubacteria group bacterium Greene1014_15]TSD07416.1 MAG: Uncharacterized protein Greene07144_908 [Parcubacteria group bacterium Greene0714_4]
MNITTKATNLVLTSAIEVYIAKKFGVLTKYVDHSDSSAGGQIEVGKTTRHHQNGDVFRAEINFHIAGKDFWTEATANDIYSAIDEAREEIVRMIRAHKGKSTSIKRAGGRAVKKIIRRGK